jgi:hypothetical protein
LVNFIILLFKNYASGSYVLLIFIIAPQMLVLKFLHHSAWVL